MCSDSTMTKGPVKIFRFSALVGQEPEQPRASTGKWESETRWINFPAPIQ